MFSNASSPPSLFLDLIRGRAPDPDRQAHGGAEAAPSPIPSLAPSPVPSPAPAPTADDVFSRRDHDLDPHAHPVPPRPPTVVPAHDRETTIKPNQPKRGPMIEL